ncbi:FtsX-like permease family protein [Cellulomonas massiliensis]|uniref:FtsX-like permease family protein n=1 Tax=Cellulomonas massiliensis TaxID=1465811 RepID=UPI00037C56DF|nr:FtsX-like permease family protein [Cellulomonas massiliensis]
MSDALVADIPVPPVRRRRVSPVVGLAPRLQRAGGSDARRTTVLAVGAFAAMTALALSVVGGLLAFSGRVDAPGLAVPPEQRGMYVTFAWTALVVLVVPLLTLGGAAARLGVARRDARLAALRLLGATPREVVGLTLVETAVQGLVGAALGFVGYLALLPLWTRFTFQGRPLAAAELWTGWQAPVVALVAVPLLAAGSGAVTLRRVVVTPLGVSQRVTPPGTRAVRVVVAVVAMAAFVVVTQVLGAFGAAAVAVLLGMFAIAFACLNAMGPWVLGVFGRRRVKRARTPEQLLAARRLAGDPRAAWRVVGGLALAGFVAGALAVLPVLVQGVGAQDGMDVVGRDLMTGGMLTLAISFVVAATSAGVTQAAAVLDRRRELVLQTLAGVPADLLHRVRRREVLGPVVLVSVGSAALALLLLLPLFGVAAVQDPRGLVLLAACLAGGVLLVLGAVEASRPLLRQVLATTTVRAD